MQAVEKGRAAGWRPTAHNRGQTEQYSNPASESSANTLVPAADVLLVLQLPLSETARPDLFALLDRRLRRAYEEAV